MRRSLHFEASYATLRPWCDLMTVSAAMCIRSMTVEMDQLYHARCCEKNLLVTFNLISFAIL
jgi:hypothetical protein